MELPSCWNKILHFLLTIHMPHTYIIPLTQVAISFPGSVRCSSEHCPWNTCCTADASSTLQLVTDAFIVTYSLSQHCGRRNNTPTNQWERVCPWGPCNTEGAHKCKQKNRSSARPGSQPSHSWHLSAKEKCHERFYWSERCQTSDFCDIYTYKYIHIYIHIDATDRITFLRILHTG